MIFRNCFLNIYLPGSYHHCHQTANEKQNGIVLFVTSIFLVCHRLKKFDPDNDDESLSNLETQCNGKEDIQPLHGSLSVDTVEYMESGM